MSCTFAQKVRFEVNSDMKKDNDVAHSINSRR